MKHDCAPPLLAIRDLSLAGPNGIDILRGVSFTLEAGEILAVVGESGSGKTMAARAVIRLLPSQIRRTGGSVLFEGREVDELADSEIRALRGRRIGMVFQEPMVSLNPAMTIGAQLLEGLLLHEKLMPQAARDRIIVMLERVQIADPEACMTAYPHQFSGGMRQRIMLASVMLLKPALLIADEPTTALDALAQREVLNLMVELARETGTAILLITHNLGLVSQYAQSVVVMERGRVVELGPVSTVLRQPRETYTRTLLDALPKRREILPAPKTIETPLIEAREVSVRFPGRGLFRRSSPKVAVDKASLAIARGETVALVGGSGSGKTTLGRAMIGLLPFSGGELHYAGTRIADAPDALKREFRLNCQLVFQDPYSSLDPRQRILDVVAEPLDHVPGLGKAEKRDRAQAMLEEVGLAGFGNRYPHALSGGQRQRVAIARAIVRNPAFVVADEPVSALDMTIQKQILELFQRLQEGHGFACLFISHDLGAVSQVADRIVVMQAGSIIEEGSADKVLDHPMHDYTRALLEAAPSL